MRALLSSSEMRPSYISAVSNQVAALRPSGKVAWSSSTYSFAAAATMRGVSLPTRNTLIITARWPL
jgi:hypothetical protein